MTFENVYIIIPPRVCGNMVHPSFNGNFSLWQYGATFNSVLRFTLKHANVFSSDTMFIFLHFPLVGKTEIPVSALFRELAPHPPHKWFDTGI